MVAFMVVGWRSKGFFHATPGVGTVMILFHKLLQ
jgi:hypothetical protein